MMLLLPFIGLCQFPQGQCIAANNCVKHLCVIFEDTPLPGFFYTCSMAAIAHLCLYPGKETNKTN